MNWHGVRKRKEESLEFKQVIAKAKPNRSSKSLQQQSCQTLDVILLWLVSSTGGKQLCVGTLPSPLASINLSVSRRHRGKCIIVLDRLGELIRNFLKNSASQLTIYGLFSLQEGLKERELCVFFRNNHFNTMFKFEGELYLIATDQGYINQPDLVWEKLNEVNGDTVFMTSNFKEFNAENPDTRSWDEQNALANTAVIRLSKEKGPICPS